MVLSPAFLERLMVWRPKSYTGDKPCSTTSTSTSKFAQETGRYMQCGHTMLTVQGHSMVHRHRADTQLRRRLFLPHAVKTQANGPHPLGDGDDRPGNGIGIPRILMQPTLQTLTRGIAQMIHHLLGRHISGAIQPHGTTTFLLT
jgi:hypothetical protein